MSVKAELSQVPSFARRGVRSDDPPSRSWTLCDKHSEQLRPPHLPGSRVTIYQARRNPCPCAYVLSSPHSSAAGDILYLRRLLHQPDRLPAHPDLRQMDAP